MSPEGQCRCQAEAGQWRQSRKLRADLFSIAGKNPLLSKPQLPNLWSSFDSIPNDQLRNILFLQLSIA
jgi:hypothetical protein